MHSLDLVGLARARYGPESVYTLWHAALGETPLERFAREVGLRWERAAGEVAESLVAGRGLAPRGGEPQAKGVASRPRRASRRPSALEARPRRRARRALAPREDEGPLDPPAEGLRGPPLAPGGSSELPVPGARRRAARRRKSLEEAVSVRPPPEVRPAPSPLLRGESTERAAGATRVRERRSRREEPPWRVAPGSEPPAAGAARGGSPLPPRPLASRGAPAARWRAGSAPPGAPRGDRGLESAAGPLARGVPSFPGVNPGAGDTARDALSAHFREHRRRAEALEEWQATQF